MEPENLKVDRKEVWLGGLATMNSGFFQRDRRIELLKIREF